MRVFIMLACCVAFVAHGAVPSQRTQRPPQRTEGPSLRANAGNHSFKGLNIATGNTSHPFDFRIYNDGDAPVTGLVAQAHGDFLIVHNACSAVMRPTPKENGCVISVAFRPSSAGRRTGDLTLSADNIAATVLRLDAGTPIQFGTVQVQATAFEWVQIPTSTALTATVTGPFSIALQANYDYGSIDGIKFGTSASGSPVAGSINLGVRLQASTPGNAQGTVTLSDGTTYDVTATVAAANAPSLSPAAIQFESVPVGGSAAQSAPFTLTNTSDAPLSIGAVQTSAPFSASNTCGAWLAAYASCTIAVTYTPTSTAEADGQVVVITGVSTLRAALQGFSDSNKENLAISPAEIFLNYTHAGDVSPTQTVSIKNLNTDKTLVVSVTPGVAACSTTVTSDCAQVVNTNCASLAPLATCQLTFSYVFGLPEGVTGGNTIVSVTGIGTGHTYQFSFDVLGPVNAGDDVLVLYPKSLTFPTTAIGQASDIQIVTLSNAASSPVQVFAPSVNGYDVESNCSVLAPETSCNLNVRFTPVDGGSVAGEIVIDAYYSDEYAGGGYIVTQGFGAVSTALASPAYPANALNITPTPVPDGTHVTYAMPVRNAGSEPLVISRAQFLGGDVPSNLYVDPSQCAAPVAPGASCVLTITFDAEGCPASGIAGNPCTSGDSLYIASNADSSPDTYTIIAEHTPSNVANPVSPGSIGVGFGTPDLGSVVIGKSATTSTTFHGSYFPIPALSVTGAGMSLDNGCASRVGSTTAICTASITFTPTAVGFVAGSIKLVSSVGMLTQSMWGTGIASPATLRLSASSEAFPATIVGATSTPQVLTLTNTGASSLGLDSFTVTGESDDFVLSNTCGASLAPGSSCSISITFQPVSGGSKSATLVIADRTASSPHTVMLTGKATIAPIALVYPASEAFGSQPVGVSTGTGNVDFEVLNTGSAPLVISSVALAGEADDFALTSNCGPALAPNASCRFAIGFKPVSVGAKSATVVVTDNAGGSPQSATVTGTGVPRAYAQLSSNHLAFPPTAVGSTSATQVLTVKNTVGGSDGLVFQGFDVTGESDDFVLTNQCVSAYLPKNATCTIVIGFKPVSAGSKAATLIITDNAASSPQKVALTGTATGN